MENQFLTNKHAILSSNGSKYNGLYFSEANSSVDMVECTFGYPKQQSLSSALFGSSSTIFLDRNTFVGDLILHCRLNMTTLNQSLCRGWLANMVQQVSYQLGSSNSTAIQLSGDSILQVQLMQCKSSEKRDKLLRLAGDEVLQPIAGKTYLDAYLLIPLPFSTLCPDTLPFDTQMLQNNIAITIQFKQNARSIYGGSDAVPNSFLLAEIINRQGNLSNKSKSLANALIENPQLKYNMPFVHTQTFESNSFQGILEGTGLCRVELNQFSNADLTNICFWVIKEADKFPSGNSTPNPWNADPISNVELKWGGQTLFTLPAQIYRLTNMLIGDQDSAAIPISRVLPGAVSPFVNQAQDVYLVSFDFSLGRSVCMPSHFFNTARYTNQSFTLSFNTSSTDQYRVYATYFYNAIAEISNLTSSIYID